MRTRGPINFINTSASPAVGTFQEVLDTDHNRDLLTIQNKSETDSIMVYFGEASQATEEESIEITPLSYFEPAIMPSNKVSLATKTGSSGPASAVLFTDAVTVAIPSSFADTRVLSTTTAGGGVGSSDNLFGDSIGDQAVFWSNSTDSFVYTPNGTSWVTRSMDDIGLSGRSLASCIIRPSNEVLYIITTDGFVWDMSDINSATLQFSLGGDITKGQSTIISQDFLVAISSNDDRILFSDDNTWSGSTNIIVPQDVTGFGYTAIELVGNNEFYTVDESNFVLSRLNIVDSGGSASANWIANNINTVNDFDRFLFPLGYPDNAVIWASSTEFYFATDQFIIPDQYSYSGTETKGDAVGSGILLGTTGSDQVTGFINGFFSEKGSVKLDTTKSIKAYAYNGNGIAYAIGGTNNNEITKLTTGL